MTTTLGVQEIIIPKAIASKVLIYTPSFPEERESFEESTLRIS